MKKSILFVIVIMAIVAISGCKKSSEDPVVVDYGASAAGTYSGNYTVTGVGQVAGTLQITKKTTTTVDLIITIMGQASPVPGVTVSDGGSGKVNFSFSDSSGNLNGTVNGKSVTMTMTASGSTVTFSGTKP